MYLPNSKMTLKLSSGKTDAYAQPTPGRTVTEPCCIVKLTNVDKKTSVRADSSASRGDAEESLVDATILAGPKTACNVHDIITVQGYKIKVNGKESRFDMNGKLDHFELTGMIWVE